MTLAAIDTINEITKYFSRNPVLIFKEAAHGEVVCEHYSQTMLRIVF